MIRAILIFVLAAMSTACSATYEMKRADSIDAPPTLNAQGSIYVSVPEDGRYSTKVYAGSGNSTTLAIVAAFSTWATQVVGGVSQESDEEGLAKAKAGGHKYLIAPKILHWEDRATEWSGRLDRVEVLLKTFDVVSGSLIDSVTIRGKSKWASFGGDHPQDLLAKPLEDYAGSLY